MSSGLLCYCRRALCAALLCLLAAAAHAQSTPRGGATLSSNPNIGVVLNGNYASFSKEVPFSVPGFALGGETGPGSEGFNLGESEIGLYGNIDPYLFGSATLSFSGEGEAEVEEAFIQTTGLPFGVSVKAGRFFSGIGYMNGQHRHVDDFFDAPLPYQAFFGGRFGDDGAQLRWLAPVNFLLEIGLESFRGDSFPAGGAAKKGAGSGAGYLKAGGDIGASQSWLIGVSQLQSKANGRTTGDEAAPESSFTGDTSVNIASLVWKWGPNGNFKETNIKFQAEYFQRTENGVYVIDPAGAAITVDAKDSNKPTQSGWYAQARYQFLQRWRVGVRQASVKAEEMKDSAAVGTVLDGQGKSPSISTAMVEYDPSEFSQVRLQYSSDKTDPKETVGRWYLQYIVTLGAHAAHTY